MFGTLNPKQQKEPLTFVENTDRASALNRSRREKPHISCESCRARKVGCLELFLHLHHFVVLCYGDSPMLAAPKAMHSKGYRTISGEALADIAWLCTCRYPDREVRRRKAPASRPGEEVGPGSSTSYSRDAASDKEQREAQGQSHKPEQSPLSVGSDQPGRKRTHTTDASVETRDPDTRTSQSKAQIKPQLSSHSVDDGSSTAGVLNGFDEWLGMDGFLDPMMMMTPLENFDGNIDMLDEDVESSLSSDANTLFDFDDLGLGSSLSNFANANSVTQPFMPVHDVVSAVNSAVPGTHRQLSASSTNSTNIGREASFQTLNSDRWSGHNSTFPDLVQSVSGPSNPTYPNPMSDPHTKWPAHPTISPGLVTRVDGPDGCSCLNLTARLLEELGAENTRTDPATIDQLLGSLRCALTQCTSILDCERCKSLSNNNMLLAMVGQYMTVICERIVKRYIEQQQAQDQRQTKQQSSTSPLVTGSDNGLRGHLKGEGSDKMSKPGAFDTDVIWFSTYRVDNEKEGIQVLQCLVKAQLLEFARLLEKLQSRVGSRRGHVVLLTVAEKKIKALRLMLRAKFDRPSDEKA
ncbi:MAG: hypothetical protein Q9205_003370 [Flavoplaca limonia]